MMMEHFEATPVGEAVSLWGEGPLWWGDALLYVDIEGRKLRRFDPASGEDRAWEAGERPGCIVPRAGGGWAMAGDLGFSFFDPESGAKTPVADPEPDKPDNRFNDGKCDPAGRFWAGTISLVKKTGDAALYVLGNDLAVRRVLGDITTSNGIVWSADGRTMYYIDTPTKQVSAFDFDAGSGTIANRRAIIDTAALGIEGSPDGMAIDAEGQLWIAFCHGGCVRRFDPATGQPTARVDVPAIETTACAFGGPGLGTLFITTGVKAGLTSRLLDSTVRGASWRRRDRRARLRWLVAKSILPTSHEPRWSRNPPPLGVVLALPVGIVILLFVLAKHAKKQHTNQPLPPPRSQPGSDAYFQPPGDSPPPPSAPASSRADRLRELERLHGEKLITADEYEAKRRAIIDEI
ncbi:MAG: SMP-30/gluconolactonase/LRE family protein [Verrucomicrobiales bacterium]